MSDPLVVAPEVKQALAEGRPVVALETTLVTHGLPAPEGRDTAHQMEAAVREEGAVPATIGVLEGRARVGLSNDELDRLAAAPGVAKLNLGNLAAQIAAGATRLDHGGRDRSSRPPRRPLGLRHRRHRRDPPGLPGDRGRLRRPGRARAHAGGRRLLGGQGDAGPAADARGPRDPGRARPRRGHRSLPRLLPARQRPSRRPRIRPHRGSRRRRASPLRPRSGDGRRRGEPGPARRTRCPRSSTRAPSAGPWSTPPRSVSADAT